MIPRIDIGRVEIALIAAVIAVWAVASIALHVWKI